MNANLVTIVGWAGGGVGALAGMGAFFAVPSICKEVVLQLGQPGWPGVNYACLGMGEASRVVWAVFLGGLFGIGAAVVGAVKAKPRS